MFKVKSYCSKNSSKKFYLVVYITFSSTAPSKVHAFVFPVPKCAFETTYHGRNWKETEESPLNLLIKRALSIRQNKLNTTCVVNRKYLNNVTSQTDFIVEGYGLKLSVLCTKAVPIQRHLHVVP